MAEMVSSEWRTSFERARVRARPARATGVAHHEPGEHRGEEDAGARRRQPVDDEDRRFRLAVRRRPAARAARACAGPARNPDDRQAVEPRLDLRQAPDEHEHAEDEPRRPRAARPARGRSPAGRRRPRRIASASARCSVDVQIASRMPDAQEQRDEPDRGHRRHDVHQPRAVIVRDEKLRDREGEPGHQNRRPDVEHAAEPGERPDQPERHEHREERELPADHRATGRSRSRSVTL